jgi:hypothetical protein
MVRAVRQITPTFGGLRRLCDCVALEHRENEAGWITFTMR